MLEVLKTILFALFILSIYQIITRTKYESESRCNYDRNRITPQEYDDKHVPMNKDQCGEILTCLTNGTWSWKEDLSQDDVQKRTTMDEYISEYQGFPKTFTRQDDRCGKNAPVTADGKANSVCDALSAKPCCNEVLGRCGNTTEHCNCKECTDFRKYLPAEIAQWNTKNEECRMKYFNHVEACSVFDEHVSEMVFIGDSLTRHIFVALALLLTNNTAMGALNIKHDIKRREQCQGELQFIDRGRYNCHGLIAHRWQELSPVCGGKAKFKISLEEDYNFKLFPNVKKTVTRLLNKTGSVVVLNVGLHMALNTKDTIDKYVAPILDMVTNSSNRWPKIIWHNLHGIDNFLRTDVEIFKIWARFNREMEVYLKGRGISILHSEQLTRGIKSYDARHFGLGGNVVKVQVLINYLKKWFEMCQKYETGR